MRWARQPPPDWKPKPQVRRRLAPPQRSVREPPLRARPVQELAAQRVVLLKVQPMLRQAERRVQQQAQQWAPQPALQPALQPVQWQAATRQAQRPLGLVRWLAWR